MKKETKAKKEDKPINSNAEDVGNTQSDNDKEMSLKESQNFDRTILNSDAENKSDDLTLAENMELGHGRNFDGMNQQLSHRVNENPDLVDRLDHDKLHPVCSDEHLAGRGHTPSKQRRQSHELVTHNLKKVHSDEHAESYGVPTGMPYMPEQQLTSRGRLDARDERTSTNNN